MTDTPLAEKAALSIREACLYAGCGRSTIYKAIREGTLVARKIRARTVILRADLDGWLSELPTVKNEGVAFRR